MMRWKRRKVKETPSILEKSEKTMQLFKSRESDKKIEILRKELQGFESKGGNRSGGFSFSLALMQVRKEIEEQEKEKYMKQITLRAAPAPKKKEKKKIENSDSSK